MLTMSAIQELLEIANSEKNFTPEQKVMIAMLCESVIESSCLTWGVQSPGNPFAETFFLQDKEERQFGEVFNRNLMDDETDGYPWLAWRLKEEYLYAEDTSGSVRVTDSKVFENRQQAIEWVTFFYKEKGFKVNE